MKTPMNATKVTGKQQAKAIKGKEGGAKVFLKLKMAAGKLSALGDIFCLGDHEI